MEKDLKKDRDLLYVFELTDLGDLGYFLRDAYFDGAGNMYRVMAASVTQSKIVKGYQAFLMDDTLGAAELLMLGDGYNKLGGYDVIFGKMNFEEYGQIVDEQIQMSLEGRSRKEINSILMEKYNSFHCGFNTITVDCDDKSDGKSKAK